MRKKNDFLGMAPFAYSKLDYSRSARWSKRCVQWQKVVQTSEKYVKKCQTGVKKGAQKGQKRLKQRQKGLKESKIWSKNRFHRSKKGSNGLNGVEKGQKFKKRGGVIKS